MTVEVAGGPCALDLDLAINSGLIIDGTGNPPYRASIGIKDGKIAGITPSEIRDAKQMIEAAGLAACPGFVDIHSHSDFALLEIMRKHGRL